MYVRMSGPRPESLINSTLYVRTYVCMYVRTYRAEFIGLAGLRLGPKIEKPKNKTLRIINFKPTRLVVIPLYNNCEILKFADNIYQHRCALVLQL